MSSNMKLDRGNPKKKALFEYLPGVVPLLLGYFFGTITLIVGVAVWVIYYYVCDVCWPRIAWDLTWDDIETALNNILSTDEGQYLHLKLKSGKTNIRVQRDGRAEENKRFYIVIKDPRLRQLEEKVDTAYIEDMCGQSPRHKKLFYSKQWHLGFNDDKYLNIIPVMKHLVNSLISLDEAVAKVPFIEPTAWIDKHCQSSTWVPITKANFWGKKDGRPIFNTPDGDMKMVMEDGTVEDFEEFDEWRKGPLDEKNPT